MSRPRATGFILHALPGAGDGLHDALSIAVRCEELGYDSFWVRDRHFQPGYFASPFVLLTAIAMRTSRIRLGTGVVVLRFENQIRLAEDAATSDLLSGGRLELGVSDSGQLRPDAHDRAFGLRIGEPYDRSDRLKRALLGAPQQVGNDTASLIVHPRVPDLADRLWYGSGTVESAERAGSGGFGLFLAPVTQEDSTRYPDVLDAQYAQIAAYRAARSAAGHAGDGRVGVSRVVLPITEPSLRPTYEALRDGYHAQNPRAREAMKQASRFQRSDLRQAPVVVGEPDEVVAALTADPVIEAADVLLFTVPDQVDVATTLKLLEDTASTVVPSLRR